MSWEADPPELLQVVHDRETGLRAAIAVHDTRRGPARGGTRLRRYASLREALDEAARLARAMHHKFGVHRLPWSGGKGVIVLDDAAAADRALLEARLRAYGAAVERISDRFGTGPDLGIGAAELAHIASATGAVTGVHAHGHAGDATAAGVLEAMRAGLAAAGRALEGARLLLADLDPARAEAGAAELGAEVVPLAAAWTAEADVLAPCATGDVLGAGEIEALRCRVVCGAANDQLRLPEAEHAAALAARGIIYIPDFVANGGAAVLLTAQGEAATAADVARAAEHVAQTASRVLAAAEARSLTPWAAALELAGDGTTASR